MTPTPGQAPQTLRPRFASVNKRAALSMKRIVLGMFALYAVVLQRAAVCALQASAFDFASALTCLKDQDSPSAPANDLSRHHGACCILACSASGFAGALVTDGVFASPDLTGSSFVTTVARARSVLKPVKFFFAARGPPPASLRLF